MSVGRTQRGSSGRPWTNFRIQLRCGAWGASDSVSGAPGSSSVVTAATPRSCPTCGLSGLACGLPGQALAPFGPAFDQFGPAFDQSGPALGPIGPAFEPSVLAYAAEGFPPDSLRCGCQSCLPLWATRTRVGWDLAERHL
jgi:hypothetical protein